jgi:hypothetical protein
MFGKSLFRLFTMIAVFALVFAQVGSAKAARMDLGGEPEDNFWYVDALFCKDGFTLTATQYYLSDQGLPYWLELGTTSIPVTIQTSVDPAARIAHGDGSALVNGTASFFFTQLQAVGTPVDIIIERWDHGNMTWIEEEDDETDHSHSDDIEHLTEADFVTIPVVEDCLIDSVAPTITITSPLAQNYLQTATISTAWNVTDNASGSGVASSSGTLDAASVANGQTVDLSTFLPGPHVLTVNAADHSGNPAQASVTFNVVVTIDSLVTALQSACSHGWISKMGSCNSLLAKLSAAKAANGRGQSQAMRGALKAFLNELKAQKSKSVNQAAYDLLSADAQYLLH